MRCKQSWEVAMVGKSIRHKAQTTSRKTESTLLTLKKDFLHFFFRKNQWKLTWYEHVSESDWHGDPWNYDCSIFVSVELANVSVQCRGISWNTRSNLSKFSSIKVQPTHKTPTINLHATNNEKLFIKADKIEKHDERTRAFKITHLRPFVSPRNPQK